jgi:hypothetical protein
VYKLAEILGKYDVPVRGRLVQTNDPLLVEFDPSLIEASALKRLIRVFDACASSSECIWSAAEPHWEPVACRPGVIDPSRVRHSVFLPGERQGFAQDRPDSG